MRLNQSRTFHVVQAALLCTIGHSLAVAAPINYGDFSDIPPGSVMYLDVTETASSLGDTEPLFGDGNASPPLNPSIAGNVLTFSPSASATSSAGSSTDTTAGTVTFTLRNGPLATNPEAMLSMSLSSSGQYSLQDSGSAGSAATQVDFLMALTSLTVTEVDGAPLASPVSLVGASTSGTDELSSGQDTDAPWSLGLEYDFNAALSAAGVPFVVGATRIEVEVTSSLTAGSETGTSSSIDLNSLSMEVSSVTVPEPAIGVLALGLLCAMPIRRRGA